MCCCVLLFSDLFCFIGKHDNDLSNVVEVVSTLKMCDVQSSALLEDHDDGKYLMSFNCWYIRSFVF